MAWAHFPVLLGEAGSRTFYQLARLQNLDQWWHWLLLLVIVAFVIAYVVATYVYDSVELPRGLSGLLMVLRLTAFIGLLVFFFNLEKRTEQKLVKNSRAIVLVDTSQSMSLHDASASPEPNPPGRIDAVISEFQSGKLLPELRQKHDVVVYRFDQNSQPAELASYTKVPIVNDEPEESAAEQVAAALREMRWMLGIAGGILAVALIAFIISRLFTPANPQKGSEPTSWALLVSMVSLIVALVVVAVASLRHPDVGLIAALGGPLPKQAEEAPDPSAEDPNAEKKPEVVWREALNPIGAETRMGDAVRYVVDRERGGPIAGVIVLSDGNSNSGLDAGASFAVARDAGIPLYMVGLGSDRRPKNVRVVDLEAPARVYPGDRFAVTGYVQAFDLKDRNVKLELFSKPADEGDEDAPEEFEEERRVRLLDDGEIITVKFDINPNDEQGRRRYRLAVQTVEGDLDERDNVKTADVEVVDRKNRVLLMAGGPTREYRFLRNQLFRDKDTTVDVLLQTARPGIAQEAHDILFEFPTEADALFEYDCLVDFDPDWTKLTREQTDLLEQWIAEKAGGMIVVAGPVYTPKWSGRRDDDALRTIESLYPVVFYRRGSVTLRLGRHEAETAWPLEFTRDGQEADFLWLGETARDSSLAWEEFEGVYGYYATDEPKPGAKVYSYFADPDTAIDGHLPIYMAGHFYGAGRVFFQASGEMWRLREDDPSRFETYYTKLIRYVSQGRLLRDSSRGVLLVDKERCLKGDTIAVRAHLTDEQFQPLTQNEVQALLIPPQDFSQPNSIPTTLTLRRIEQSARPGMYAGQFTATQEGDYRVELPIAGSDQILEAAVRSRLPDLEIERPQRNNALLSLAADQTGGYYFVGLEDALGRTGAAPLAGRLDPPDQETYLPGTPDRNFEQLLMTWLLALIAGALCLEWLLRRTSKLA